MSITRVAGLLGKVYNAPKLRHQNFLINYVGVSVYHHLNEATQSVAKTETQTPAVMKYDVIIHDQLNKGLCGED